MVALNPRAVLKSVFVKPKIGITALIAGCISVFSSVVWSQPGLVHQFYHDGVLGTSFTLKVQGERADAERIETEVLNTIAELSSVFSSYDPQSEVSRLNSGQTLKPSASLRALIQQCEHWQGTFPLAFSCRLGAVIKRWQLAEDEQQVPERARVRALARSALNSDFGLEQIRAGQTNPDYQWNFGGIAKGYILDESLAKAIASAGDRVHAIAIDIGGDGVYWQKDQAASPWRIGLAVPGAVDDAGGNRLGELAIHSGAIAYSGHDSRRRQIGRRSFSHILAPRDGWPKFHPLTAVVAAPNATQADALATALTTMDIHKGLDWINKNSQFSALLIDEKGRQFASDNWQQNYQSSAEFEPAKATINFSLPRLSISNYRKPYVALWIEDENRKAVKTLMLLGDSERWMSENRFWWRAQGRDAPELLLQGFARATRRAGDYQVAWNGRDDYGQRLTPGNYTLYLEAAREHGDHERLAIPFVWGGGEINAVKKGRKELKRLSIKTD